jgi:hypothetical protein
VLENEKWAENVKKKEKVGCMSVFYSTFAQFFSNYQKGIRNYGSEDYSSDCVLRRDDWRGMVLP